jgi:hypothetical protein
LAGYSTVALTQARIGHAQNKPVCALHVDDAENLAAKRNGGSRA